MLKHLLRTLLLSLVAVLVFAKSSPNPLERRDKLVLRIPVVRSSNSSVISNVCSTASSALDQLCSRKINIPIGATVETEKKCTPIPCCSYPCDQKKCTNNVCTWRCPSQCVSKCCDYKCSSWLGRCYGCRADKCGEICIPCSGASKQHCGETCIDVPCTGCVPGKCGSACVIVPVALKIQYKTVTPCDLIPATLVETAIKTCPCLTLLKNFLVIPRGTGPYFIALAEVVECIVQKGFSVDSNEDEVVASLDDGDDHVILAPDIGLKLYASTAGAAIGCAAAGTCDSIAYIYLDYFKKVGTTIGDGILDFVNDFFIGRVTNMVEKQYQDLSLSIKELPGKVTLAIDECSESLPAAVIKEGVAALESFQDDFTQIVTRAEEFKAKTTGFVAGFKDILDLLGKDYEDHVLDLLTKGTVPNLSDSVEFIKDARELKDHVDAFGALLSDVKTGFSNVERFGAAVDNVIDALSMSQEVCKEKVLKPFQDILSIKNEAQSALGSLMKIEVGENTIVGGFATYQNTIDISVDLPCSKTSKKSFSISGLSGVSLPYPEFYACSYGTTVKFNEHIPYLRLKNLKL